MNRRKWVGVIEAGLWVLVVAGSLAFLGIKLRNWEPLDKMPQDDFAAMYIGAKVAQIDPVQLYHPEQWHALTGSDLHLPGPFPYAPTVAIPFFSLTSLPYPQAGIWWLVADIGIVAIIVALLAWYAWRRRNWAPFLGAGLWLLLPATADNVYLGNINLVIALLITLAYLLFGSPRALLEALSGFAVGVAASIKPNPLLLAVLAPWARRWWFLAGMAVGLPTALFLGVVRLGVGVYGAYAEMLRAYYVNLAPPGASILQNQSLMALAQKLAYSGSLELRVHEQAAGVVAVSPLLDVTLARPFGLLLSLVVAGLTVWALWHLNPREWIGQTLGWTLLLAAMLMVPPLSWSLYVMQVPPLHGGLLVARRELSPGWRLLLPLGYLLILVQRGYALWLPYLPVLALTSAGLAGVALWWVAVMRLAAGRAAVSRAPAAEGWHGQP